MNDTYNEVEEKIREVFDDATQKSLGSYDDIDYYDEDDFYNDTYEEPSYDSNLEEISEIVDTEIENFLIKREFRDLFRLYYFLSHLMQEVSDTEISHAFYEELYDIRDSIATALQNFLMDGSENDKNEFFQWVLENIDYLVDDTYDAVYHEVEDYVLDNINMETSVYSNNLINAYETFSANLPDEFVFIENHPLIYKKYLKMLGKGDEASIQKANDLRDKFLNQGILELETVKF